MKFILLIYLTIFYQFIDQASSSVFSLDGYEIEWTEKEEYVEFKFSTIVKISNNIWTSFALSFDQIMGNDNALICKIFGSQQTVEHAFNSEKSRPNVLSEQNPSVGLSNIKVQFEDNKLTCSFNRQKSLPDINNYFNTNSSYYILLARGTINENGILNYHLQDRTSSDNLLNFHSNQENSEATFISTETTSTKLSLSSTRPEIGQFISSGSFSSKGYLLSWKGTQEYTVFSSEKSIQSKNMRIKRQNSFPNVYIGFGLSEDKIMGDDCIVVCKINNNVGIVEHYYSTGRFLPGLLKSDEPNIGISDAIVVYENGKLLCNFTRKKTIQGQSRYCDLKTNSYYLLVADGPIRNNIIQYHGPSYVISDEKIDFSANQTFSGSTRDLKKAKAHACIMVFTWLFCVSTGIILARYYKYIFPSIKIQKMMFWFQAHRAIMILSPIFSIAAFLVILADLEWKWIEKTNKVSFAHSIFGIVLIGLSLIQVLMGFLRPDKDKKFRPVFNLIHRFTGISLLVFAIVACYLGVFIERMNLGNEGWGILTGWTLWVIILPLLIEIIQISSSYSIGNAYEVGQKTNNNRKMVENMKSFLLILHLIIALGHVIALMVIIGIA